jgi:hypothetical protein
VQLGPERVDTTMVVFPHFSFRVAEKTSDVVMSRDVFRDSFPQSVITQSEWPLKVSDKRERNVRAS